MYKSSKYSAAKNAEMSIAALDVLTNSPIAMTIEQIKSASFDLTNCTDQKIARVLNDLVDKGFAFKAKSKSKKRMVYISAQTMEANGFNLDEVTVE